MKIAVDCRFWGVKHTGLGRYTQALVENLLKKDKENSYFLFFDKQDKKTLTQKGSGFSQLVKTGRPVKPGRSVKTAGPAKTKVEFLNARPYSLKEQLILPRVINQFKPDLVHFPHFNVPVLAGLPYVVTIHDLIKHHFRGPATTTRPPWTYGLKYLGYKLVFKRAVKRAARIIAPSQAVKGELLKVYPLEAEKVKVVYEGVDDQFIKSRPKQAKAKKILEKYQIQTPFIIYTGNVYPHKNLKRLILAVKMINQSIVRSKSGTGLTEVDKAALSLVIVSARDIFWRRLKAMIEKTNANQFVCLPGFVPDQDLSLIYSQAEAFVTASLMEGFGLPGLEAMASSCPVISSDLDIFQEIYGSAALYFNPKEIEDIREKIVQMLECSRTKRQKLVKRGKEQAAKYSWEKCSRQTRKVYQEVYQEALGDYSEKTKR